MKFVVIKNAISSLLTPLLFANLAGLAAGAVWLGAVSQWQVIWIGVVTVLFSPYIIPILLMPAGILSHFMSLYQNAGRRGKERLMFILSLVYILLFMTLWCAGIFEYVTGSVKPGALFAALLFGGSAAMLPLLLWSHRDRNNTFVMTLVEVAQAGILILSGVRIFGLAPPFWLSFIIFGGIMVFMSVVQAVYERFFMNEPGINRH
jgi:hypothetical protein